MKYETQYRVRYWIGWNFEPIAGYRWYHYASKDLDKAVAHANTMVKLGRQHVAVFAIAEDGSETLMIDYDK